MKDKRYTVTREWTGHASARPRYVVRFCGTRIADRAFRASAWEVARTHNRERQAALSGILSKPDPPPAFLKKNLQLIRKYR